MPEVTVERRQSLQSLERGMAVIQIFSRERPALTLSDVARLTGMTRATARRILLTLESLGHVKSEGRLFSLTPRVLTLGWAYLSSLNLWEVAYPLMEELVEQTGESCSAATLDLPDVVYVARMPTRRIMSTSLGVGSRLPVHATSLGRVLLAGLSEQELDEFLDEAELPELTPYTITVPGTLAVEVARARAQGWALVDQELELGLCSIAVPIKGPSCRTVAALNTSASTLRVSTEEFVEKILPPLRKTAELISASYQPAATEPVLSMPHVTPNGRAGGVGMGS